MGVTLPSSPPACACGPSLAGTGRGVESMPTPSPLTPDQFPQRLAELGFVARTRSNVAYIVPPLCPVPAGPFVIGSDSQQDKDTQSDEQQHIVTVPAFSIAKYPVT